MAAADLRFQAETGVVTDARVVADDAASGLAKVGGLDNPDSSVAVEVYADRTGPWTLGIRYDNGSLDSTNMAVAATDAVTINGRPQRDLVLPNTAWGNWQTAEYSAWLKRGWNTVQLTKKTYYSEIDAIDLYHSHPAPVAAVPSGPSTRYEAESGVITDARVVADPSASAGAKVGGLDHPDSSDTLTVTAAKSGWATLGIRYGNGSLDNSGFAVSATDAVQVNGKDAGTIAFRNTTWDNWQVTPYRVKLKRGSNTITFTKKTFYTELDAIDVY